MAAKKRKGLAALLRALTSPQGVELIVQFIQLLLRPRSKPS